MCDLAEHLLLEEMTRTDELALLASIARGLGNKLSGYQPPKERLEDMLAGDADDRDDPELRRLRILGVAGHDGDISTVAEGRD